MADLESINSLIEDLLQQKITTSQNTETSSELPTESLKNLVCSKCHQEIKNYHEIYEGRAIFYRCNCEREEEVKKINAEVETEKREKIQKLFSCANIGKRFINCSFKNFQKRAGVEKAFNAALDFSKNFKQKQETGEGILFYGGSGNGKTHLAVAIVREVVRQGYSAIFQPAAELQYRLNATYHDSGESETEIMSGLVESDLTVIDDLGKGKWSEKVEERFYVILDGRYRELRPTVITTNLKLSDLEKYVGNAVMDRLKEMTVFVLNSAKSYRALKIEEA
jgi:DNA replication protein DnaC